MSDFSFGADMSLEIRASRRTAGPSNTASSRPPTPAALPTKWSSRNSAGRRRRVAAPAPEPAVEVEMEERRETRRCRGDGVVRTRWTA